MGHCPLRHCTAGVSSGSGIMRANGEIVMRRDDDVTPEAERGGGVKVT